MIEFIAFVGLILPKIMPYLIGMLVWALLREIQKQQARKPIGKLQRTNKPLAVKPGHSGVKRETETMLYSMCGGDHELVKRLTRGGGQAAWEKAIYDLERDRR